MEKKHLVYYLIVVLGFISSLVILTGRMKMEGSSRSVDLVMDYDSVISMCKDEGVSSDQVFADMKKAGITSIAFTEMNIDGLQREGKLRWIYGYEFKGNLRLRGMSESDIDSLNIDPTSIYIFDYSPHMGNRIKENFELIHGWKNIPPPEEKEILISAGNPESPNRSVKFIRLSPSPDKIPYLSLGFNKEEINKIHNMGFNIILRPENRENMDGERIKVYLADMKNIPGTVGVIFGGNRNEVLGFPLNLDATVDGFKESGLALGDIEVPSVDAKQKGVQYLTQRLVSQTVRVQSITPLYLSKMAPENAVDMFRLGVRERNIRMLYLRPYPRGMDGENIIDTNIKYISMLKSQLGKYGFVMGTASRMPKTDPHPVLLVLIAGAGAVFFLLTLEIFYDKGEKWFIPLILSAVIPTLLLCLIKKEYLAQQIMALGISSIVPVYAFSSHFDIFKRIEKQTKFFDVWKTALLSLIKISLITTMGGLMVSATLSSTSFMLAIEGFRGIKLLMLLPPVVILALYYIKGRFQPGNIMGFFKQPLYLWQVAVLGMVGAVGTFYILRTGNAPESMTSDSERGLRVLFEQIFWVRPRFKDFFIGNPALMISSALYSMKIPWGLALFLLMATIGQVDIMDTFAHIHTPVFISLIRIIHGILLGIPFGTIFLAVLWGAKKYIPPFENPTV